MPACPIRKTREERGWSRIEEEPAGALRVAASIEAQSGCQRQKLRSIDGLLLSGGEGRCSVCKISLAQNTDERAILDIGDARSDREVRADMPRCRKRGNRGHTVAIGPEILRVAPVECGGRGQDGGRGMAGKQTDREKEEWECMILLHNSPP